MVAASALCEHYPILSDGGVTSALGFKACGIHAGFRKDPNRKDMALLVADEACSTAAVFTRNIFCAPPISVSRKHLDDVGYGSARVLMINSGVANAATGEVGMARAEETTQMAAEFFSVPSNEVLVASTGVIGVQLTLEPFQVGLELSKEALSVDGGHDAARAIMTTDTHPKEAAIQFSGDGIGYDGATFTIGGMTKGSGMIMPNMATMIAVFTTDAPVEPSALHSALTAAVAESFNKITVDSDTSTNDCCFLFASGKAVSPDAAYITEDSAAYPVFTKALTCVCAKLAREMAADGEGATRLVTVQVKGARSPEDADLAARTIANSPLVKTAIAGHDANWGRIAAAAGRSGACFRQEDVSISIMGIPVCEKGLALVFDEDEALKRFEEPEIVLDVDLGAGEYNTTVWTCDFTHDYISINGDYRS